MQRNSKSSTPASKDNNPQAVSPEWPRQQIVAQARQFLAGGGYKARRELVRTALELDRLLAEAHCART